LLEDELVSVVAELELLVDRVPPGEVALPWLVLVALLLEPLLVPV